MAAVALIYRRLKVQSWSPVTGQESGCIGNPRQKSSHCNRKRAAQRASSLRRQRSPQKSSYFLSSYTVGLPPTYIEGVVEALPHFGADIGAGLEDSFSGWMPP